MNVNRMVLANEIIDIARNADGVVVTATIYRVEDVYGTRYFDDVGNDIYDTNLRTEIDEAIKRRDADLA